jgi:DNA-binding MarR family transcriptional regulator
MDDPKQLSLASLDLGYLALFVGQRMNALVLSRLLEEGFVGLRNSHGYVLQHFVGAERGVSALAARMKVTQQAASKSSSELVSLGYLEEAPTEDARFRRLRLSTQGQRVIERSRALRAEVEAEALRGQCAEHTDAARAVLTAMLSNLGGADAVLSRAVPEPAAPLSKRSRKP